MLQSYAFIRKNNAFSEIFVLNFAKSNNMKGNGKKNGGYPRRVTTIFISSTPCGCAKYCRRKG